MRKFLILIFALLFLICTGCGKEKAKTEATQQPTSVETQPLTEPSQIPAETQDIPEVPETTLSIEPEIMHPTESKTTLPTEPETSTPAESQPEGYVERIPLADQSIFSGPTYDSYFVGVVGKATNYTIVEEATDAEGNLWGKLKSGVGWVDLTQIRSGEREKLGVTVNFADKALLEDKNTLRYSQSQEAFAIQVAFRPTQNIRVFTLSEYVFGGEFYEMGETLFSAPEMSPETPLVADLLFSGDFTMYMITFLDEEGVPHNYCIGESGRNGTIYMEELAP